MHSQSDRQIRVFISSTFRDMGAERDHLVKFIFPQLRKLCESRGVTWGEVDLRWGVTDEAAAEGKVLPICLEEIKRCRPYFIGLLGERYGWVPQSIPEELIKREPWLEEQMQEHKSVTELEILHGVLNNPQMAGHAFFYLRDPAYLNTLPKEAKREDFTTEDTESTQKLRLLKQQIRTSGFPVRENYDKPETLGNLVLTDLTKVINDTWPEGSQLDPLDREAADHEAFAQSRAHVYIGRDKYFQKLDTHASGTGDQPLVILGESGSGKSALLANWALHHRASHPDDLLLLHFIGGTPYSSDWAAMLRRIMGEFKRKFGVTQDIPDQPDALRAAFANWLHMAAAKGRIILILDALNQLEDRDGAPDLVWLPPVMPENVRLIVSSLPGRALDEINKRRWPVLHVQALDTRERQQLIEKYLAQYTKALSPARAMRIAEAPQSANPLYLRALLEELRLFGQHERLDERITHYLQADTIPELYEKILARWAADYSGGTHLVRDTMTLLWAARRGLSEAELLDALGTVNAKGEHKPLPHAVGSPLFLAAGHCLVSRSGLLTFFHDYLRDAVRNANLPNEENQRAAHLRLADYFAPQPASPRQLDELPWQLSEAAAWQRLYRLLAGHEFFMLAWKMNEFDVKTCWMQIEAGSKLRMVGAYRALIERPAIEPDKDYVWNLGSLLRSTGYLEEAQILEKSLVDHFRGSSDQNRLQWALGDHALTLRDMGNLEGAMELHMEAEQVCRRLENLDGLAAALGNQAVILQDRGDMDGAMARHKEEEKIYRKLGYMKGLAQSLGHQALIHQFYGNMDQAMTLHHEEEHIWRTLCDVEGLSVSLGNQALIHKRNGDLNRAAALLKEAETICRKLGNIRDLAKTFVNQANILKARGDFTGAMNLHKESERICRERGMVSGIAHSLANQASIMADKMSCPQQALPLVEEAYRLAQEHGMVALASRLDPFLDDVRQAALNEVFNQSDSLVHPTSTSTPIALQCESSPSNLREMASRAFEKCEWEAAASHLEELLQQGAPLEAFAPKLITALLNAHESISAHAVARVRHLITELDDYGHFDVALAMRRQLEDKVPPPKKPWWKRW